MPLKNLVYGVELYYKDNTKDVYKLGYDPAHKGLSKIFFKTSNGSWKDLGSFDNKNLQDWFNLAVDEKERKSFEELWI